MMDYKLPTKSEMALTILCVVIAVVAMFLFFAASGG